MIPLAALERGDISRWVNLMKANGASGKTCQNKVGFLSGCLNAAVRDGKLRANPAVSIKLPRTVRRPMVCMTRDEYDILRVAFTERWWPLLNFLVTSGCRFSEATALTPADITVATGSVRINKAWKKVDDAGDGADRYEIGQPKSERSNRSVRVPASVIEQLDLDGEYVFTNSKGGPIRLYSWRSNVWDKSMKRARTVDPKNPDKAVLKKAVRIHDLRHTNASWAMNAGVPLIEVSAHLGHEDAVTTSKIYGHLLPNAGQAVADAMAELLNPAKALAGAF
jgi:integrase